MKDRRRAEAIRELKKHQPALKRMGATSLYLFGSTARNRASASSDIDVFIEYKRGARFSLFDVLAIRNYLTRKLNRRVDVIPRDSFKAAVRTAAEKDAIRVY